MTHSILSAAQRIAVLEQLADLTPLDTVAAAHGIPASELQIVVAHYGYPDPVRMHHALAMLRFRRAQENKNEGEAAAPASSDDSPPPAAAPAGPALAAAPPPLAQEDVLGEVSGTCDWGDCDVDAVATRWSPAHGAHLPVCAAHRAPPAGDASPRLLVMPLRELVTDAGNVREKTGDVSELAASMAQVGLLQPVVARRDASGRLVVVAGHRRVAAARLLAWATVDVVVRADMRPDEVLAAMLVENGHRRDLDPIEEARGLRRLKAQLGECADRELAARVGRTQVHVSARLALLSLPPEQQDLIRAGRMTLADGVRAGRARSGRVRPSGATGSPHLGSTHPLAARVRARCSRLQHRWKGRNSVGGVGCGDCWEQVIRADELDRLHAHSATRGSCALCDTPTNPVPLVTAQEAQR